MRLCNYRCSTGDRCYYEVTSLQIFCYFHDKVCDGFIDGYYENLTADNRDNRWVSL